MSMIIKYVTFLCLIFLFGFQAQAQDRTSDIIMIISGGQDIVYNPPVTHSFQPIEREPSNSQLHVGLVGNFLFYDSNEQNATGGGGAVVATYSNSKHIWAQGQLGYNYLFSNLGDERALQYSGALGYADGAFAVGFDVGSVQFLKSSQKGAMSFGLIGQFATNVGDNFCVIAGLRFGILKKRLSTYYQSLFFGAQYRL